jgi:hypothetical protein
MSTPYPEELGDWFPYSYRSLTKLNNPVILEHHGAFFKAHAHLNEVELDSKLRQKALRQIHADPMKYAKNWVANLGRLFFNYPYSYEQQKVSTYFFLVPNGFLVVLALLCIYPTWVARNRIPIEIVTLGAFGIITIAGSSLLSAYARFLVPVIPIASLWICYVISQIVTIQIRKS